MEFLLVYLRGLADVNQWHGWSDHSQMIIVSFDWDETKCLSQAGGKKKHVYKYCISCVLVTVPLEWRSSRDWEGVGASLEAGGFLKNLPDLLSKLF